MAISGGRIVFTGEAAEAKRYVGPATKVIDLGGRMVMPGIVDGHFHGTRATDCHLGYEGGTVPQILARLQACLDRPDQAALKGTGTRFEATYLFGDAIEPPGTGLTRHDLDRLDTTRPILVRNADGHKFWMNTRAIANAGLDEKTPDSPGGTIGREAERRPDGFFADYEVGNWGPRAPVTDEARLELVRRTSADANRAGITTVFVPGDGEEEIAFWAKLRDEGQLTVRANVGLSAGFVLDNPDPAILQQKIEALGAWKRYGKGNLEVTSVKIYCDGNMEYPALTAAMLATIAATPAPPTRRSGSRERRGGPIPRAPRPDPASSRSTAPAGRSTCTRSATGPPGTPSTTSRGRGRRTAAATSATRSRTSKRSTGRTSHASRSSVSSRACRCNGRGATPTPRRARGVDRGRPLRAAVPRGGAVGGGALVAGGSDYPVDPLRPLVQIETAVDRTGEAVPGVFAGALAQGEAIDDLLAVVKMHTINAAAQLHHEREIGSLEVGKQADLVVLSQNLFKVPTEQISETRVLLTMMGGRVVFDEGSLARP